MLVIDAGVGCWHWCLSLVLELGFEVGVDVRLIWCWGWCWSMVLVLWLAFVLELMFVIGAWVGVRVSV